MSLDKIIKIELNKCVWKMVSDHQSKEYPTFPEDNECKKCDGYKFKCESYIPKVAYR